MGHDSISKYMHTEQNTLNLINAFLNFITSNQLQINHNLSNKTIKKNIKLLRLNMSRVFWPLIRAVYKVNIIIQSMFNMLYWHSFVWAFKTKTTLKCELCWKKIKVSIRSMNVNRIVFHRKSDVNSDKRLKNLKIIGKLQYTLTIFNFFKS